ncbi:MAG: hypothetical protein GF398_05395 [Chitinivibrionales bacterium]|nr:hypothetical protein [Chitinivibrionales bacterium]
MKRGAPVLLICCMVAVSVVSSFAANGEKANQYVEVKAPFANVYEFLDPKSKIIVQATKGETFPLVYAGTSWFQIKVSDKVGWIERRAGVIVDEPNTFPVVELLGFIILLVLTIGGVFYIIQRQKTAEL